MQEMWVQSLGREDPLEKGMATHSSIFAWRIPWTEEPGGLQSIGSQKVRHELKRLGTHAQAWVRERPQTKVKHNPGGKAWTQSQFKSRAKSIKWSNHLPPCGYKLRMDITSSKQVTASQSMGIHWIPGKCHAAFQVLKTEWKPPSSKKMLVSQPQQGALWYGKKLGFCLDLTLPLNSVTSGKPC